MNRFFLIIVSLNFCMCQSDKTETVLYSHNKDDIKSALLISANDAQEMINKDKEGVRIIHVGKKASFDSDHIPNAFQIWRDDYSTTVNGSIGGMMASKEQIQNILQRIGFHEDISLLIYDSKANVDAMRFAWVLELHGFFNFKIINGGLKYWKQSGLETTSDSTQTYKPSYFELNTKLNLSSNSSFGFVKSILDDEDYVIVDTREEYEYKGEPFERDGKIFKYKKGAYNRGKIPGAIHLNWSQLVDLSGDHRIKSEKDLRHNLELKGITDDKSIVVYCQSGSRSSNTYFILQHVLNYRNVKNYDGSWIEWSYMHNQDPELPIEQICQEDEFNLLYQELISKQNNEL